MKTADAKAQNLSSAANEKAPVLAYINVGKRKETDEGKSFMVSPFFGMDITEKPRKNGLGKEDKKLHAAILAKIEALRADPSNIGKAHTINLDVEIFITDLEKSDDVDTGDYDL